MISAGLSSRDHGGRVVVAPRGELDAAGVASAAAALAPILRWLNVITQPVPLRIPAVLLPRPGAAMAAHGLERQRPGAGPQPVHGRTSYRRPGAGIAVPPGQNVLGGKARRSLARRVRELAVLAASACAS